MNRALTFCNWFVGQFADGGVVVIMCESYLVSVPYSPHKALLRSRTCNIYGSIARTSYKHGKVRPRGGVMRLRPRTYSGKTNEDDVEGWLIHSENICRVNETDSDTQKVAFGEHKRRCHTPRSNELEMDGRRWAHVG